MEIGAFTFADVSPTRGVDARQRIPELLEEIALADQVGLDVFGLGEHHRDYFAAPAPAVLLAAAAARTSRIRLTSAVTVLSSDDPVRVFEQFTALDLASEGRAELMVGRGALLDSFRIFGHDIEDYDDLFDEKLRLLLRVRDEAPVTWSGRFRPPLDGETIMPRPAQSTLPVNVAVGGSPNSVVRAAELGLPITIGTVGGLATQFEPLVELYRRALEHYGRAPLPVAVTLHGFVADTDQRAEEIYYPADADLFNAVGRDHGIPHQRPSDIAHKNGHGSMYAVGSPEKVAEKLLLQHEVFHHQRVMMQLAVGPLPHADVMRAIELLGTKTAPLVREEVARREASASVAPSEVDAMSV